MASIECFPESQSFCAQIRSAKVSKEQTSCPTKTFEVFEYSGQRDLDPNQVECFLTIASETLEGVPDEKRNKLLCQICKLSFEGMTSRHRLLEHTNSIHSFNIHDKGEICHVCNTVFYTTKSLKIHKSLCVRNSGDSISSKPELSDSNEEIDRQEDENNKSTSENTESNTTSNSQHGIQPAIETEAPMIKENSVIPKDVSNRSFKCCICSKVFQMIRDFRLHITSNHKNELDERDFDDLSYRCKKCTTTFPNIILLRGHFFKKHAALLIYRCILCHVTLKTKKSLRIHYNKFHAYKTKELRSCGECGKELVNLKALKAHIRLKHGQNNIKQGFRCRLCQQKFDTKENRKLHYEEKHLGESPFICTDCGKGFSSKSGLYGHRQLHKTDQPSTCPYCEKVFNRRDSYHEHILIHIGPRHRCPHCPKEFVQRSNLVRHIRIHTGQKPYTCTFCDKRFSDKGACNSHIRVHTKEEQCTCPYCGQTFTKKQKLKYHIRKHTGEGLISCEICAKTFTNAFALKEHRAIHDRQTQTICVECGKAFNSAKYLQRHIALVHQDPQDSRVAIHCPICGKTFCHRTRLKSHLVTHLGKKHLQCLICEKRYSSTKSIRNHLKHSHDLSPNQPEFKKFIRSVFESNQISVNSTQLAENLSPQVTSKDKAVNFLFKTESNRLALKSDEEFVGNKVTGKDKGVKWTSTIYDKAPITCSLGDEELVSADKNRRNTETTEVIHNKNSIKKPQEAKNAKSSMERNNHEYTVASDDKNINEDDPLCIKTKDISNYNQNYIVECKTASSLATVKETGGISHEKNNTVLNVFYERTTHAVDINFEAKSSDNEIKPIILDKVLFLNQELSPRQLEANSSAIMGNCNNYNNEGNCCEDRNNSTNEEIVPVCKDVDCVKVLEKESRLNFELSKEISRRRKQLGIPKKYVSPTNTLEIVDNKLINIMPKRERVEAIARSLKNSSNSRGIVIEQKTK